jgi:hypothetical protein
MRRTSMKQRSKAGGIVSLFGAVVGIVGVFAAFLLSYQPMMNAKVTVGRADEALIIQYAIPFLSDVGIASGVTWAVAAYGFFGKRPWAWTLAVIANVMTLLAGFFSMIPAVIEGLFPTFIVVFAPGLLLYFLLLTYVRHVDGRIVALSLFSGMAYITAFMNGVASTDKIILYGDPLMIALQRLNWFAAAGWGVFTVGLLNRKAWVKPLGLGAGLMTLVAGVPLAIASTIAEGRFSLFSPAPLLALVVLAALLAPAGSRLVKQWTENQPRETRAKA